MTRFPAIMRRDPFTIGIIQDHATDDAAANVARAVQLIRQAASRGAQIVCLKELFNTPYFAKSTRVEHFDLAEPVPGPITSSYGLRMHPILGYARMHRGLDFRAGYGSPIVAVTDGVVARAGWAGGYGSQVRLNHAGGLSTSYSHMSRIAVAPGRPGKRGHMPCASALRLVEAFRPPCASYIQ